MLRSIYYTALICLITCAVKAQKVGDVKYGLQTADHNGWYLMNGRALGTLSATAGNNALSIGITGTLANASDKILKSKSSTESMGSVGGSNTMVLSQASLPNYVVTAVTDISGSHTHVWRDSHDSNMGGNGTTGSSYLHQNIAETRTTASDGDHSHTLPNISSGGSAAPISVLPSFVSVNVFIYLGV